MPRLLGALLAGLLMLGFAPRASAQRMSVVNPYVGPGTMVDHPYGYYSGGFYGMNDGANVSNPDLTPAYPRGLNPVNPEYRGAVTFPFTYNNAYPISGYSFYGQAPFVGYSSYGGTTRVGGDVRGVMDRRLIFW